MEDRSDDPSHHERTLLPRCYISSRVWTISVDREKHAIHYSGKNKTNYSTPNLIKIDILFVCVSLKTGRFPAPIGRPGDVDQHREAPGETGRLNMSVFLILNRPTEAVSFIKNILLNV